MEALETPANLNKFQQVLKFCKYLGKFLKIDKRFCLMCPKYCQNIKVLSSIQLYIMDKPKYCFFQINGPGSPEPKVLYPYLFESYPIFSKNIHARTLKFDTIIIKNKS